MAVPQKTVNKQTCTPWNDVDPFPHDAVANGNNDLFGSEFPGVVEKDTQTEDGNLSPCGFNDTPESSFKFVDSTDDVPANVKMADVGTECMAIPDGSGGCHDDPLPESKASKAIWGDAFGAIPSESSDVLTGPSEPDQNRQTLGSNGTAVDPFAQDGSTSGGGFSDNFCEMTETDLIFRSGLVDEFKTICVTAEEDDLWSSFPQSEESTAWANHSATHESWDPFPANQQASEPFPANQQPAEIGSNLGAMQSEPNLSTVDNSQTDQLLSIHHQTEITSDVLIPKAPNSLQSDSTKHSNSAVLPLEGKTSVLSNQLSTNGNVQCIGAPGTSGSIEASGSKPQDVGQMLKDATFRDSILDGPWMAEVDCLESKAFTVDLNKNPLSQDIEVKSSNMDLLSDQAVPDPSSQIDQNNLWRSNNEGIALPPPADVNANKEANGGILFGDTGTQEPKTVVAPPPEFDNSLDPLTDKAEPNGTLVFANSNQINRNVNIQFELQGNLDKGNDRGRTPSDLDRFLNELGDGTVIDDEATGNGSGQSPNDEEKIVSKLGYDAEKEDAKIERGQSPSDVLRLLNDLGDGTAVDEEVRQIDGVQSPSDVLRFLNELGDGTVVDEEEKQININEGQTLNNVDQVQNDLGDVMTIDDCDKQRDRAEILGDGNHVLNDSGDAMIVDEQDKQINRPEAPSGVYHVPSEFGDSTTVDEQDKQTDRPETHVQNNLGDCTTFDEQDKQISRPEAPSDVGHGPSECRDSTTVDEQDKQTDRPETQSDVDHVQNNLGDRTAVDEEEKQTDKGQPLIEVNQVLKDFEEDTEPAVVKLTDRGRSQSDVERLLNELGDGTVVDEEDDSLMTSEMENEDNLDSLAQEEDQMLEKVGEASASPEPSSQEGISALSTDEAWDEMVRESTVALQERVPDESSNLNGLLEGSDQAIDTQTTEAPQDDKEVAVERTTPAEKDTTEPEVSEANTKLDLNAKRRSFFGDEDVNTTDASFQPTITDKPPPSSPVSSINLSLALPNVPVLPKVQTAYHRPESFYETKPRAATDSFLSSHALLGLGGDQAIITDTKSRSASEPPPSSITGIQPETSNGVTSPRSKDPSIEAKSTKFIRALYGPKPGSKASELVDEDGKTLFEYEQERRDLLSAMKVKRKKKVNWQHDDSQLEDLPTPETEDPVSQANRKDIKSPTEPQRLNSKESQDNSEESPLAQNTEPELCKSPENVVQSHKIMSKENVMENKPQFAPAKISPEPQSTSSEDATPVRSTKPPSKIEDTLTREEDAEKKKMPSIESASPHVESQSDFSKATPTVAEQPKAGLGESQAEDGEEETPADMKKIRSLWEQKASTETGKEAEKQMPRRPQPRRMFSFEGKAKVDEVKKRESQNDPQPITREAVKVDTSDAMPRDVDDAFDHCESYTYEVNPERKVTIQSHRTTESIIEQEIRKQREREQEFQKQGLQRSSADQGAVFKEGTKVQLAKPDQDVTAYEFEQQSPKLDESSPNIKTPSSRPKQPGLKTSPAALRQNLRATPVKWAESEIKQESVQAQESQPDSRSLGNNSEPVMIIKEKEEISKPDSDARRDEPQRKESIVQREIRLQKERDEQNAIERQKALEETRIRRASFDSSSQSSQGDSGRSTPVRIPQSPVKLSPTSTPNKPSSPPTGSSGFTPIKPALLPSGLKTADSSPSVTKSKDKSPVVRFGLSSMQTTQYSSYREYQRMLRGRKTSEKTSDKPGPMKATEGGGAVKQSPVSVVLKDSPAKEQAQQRPPSPLLRRSPSPVFNRPPSPSPYQPTSPVANPVDPGLKDSSESKSETAVQQEIRLAKERDAQLQEERLATNTALKKDFNVDVTDVVIVEKPQDTKSTTEGSQVTERSKSGSSPQPEVVMRKRETPMERDIRLNEEREMMLRKEREETLSPVKKRLNTQTETLLEREIRLEREREEQYRLEKGIKSPTSTKLAGADGGTQGVTDSVGKAAVADTPTAEAMKPKYRPQRRSLVLAQQWEQMFK